MEEHLFSREELESVLRNITPPNEEMRKAAGELLDSLFKPIAGLGRLETMLMQIAAIQETTHIAIHKKAIVVMCSDNGVVVEGVTQTDNQITAMVMKNMASGEASVCRMSKMIGCDVIPVDVGVVSPVSVPGLVVHKIAYGTKNMKVEPAMTRAEAVEAILVGVHIVKELKEKGYQLLGTGEMGIGNTTTSSAVASVLLEQPVELVTGKGAGLSKEGILRKVEVIKEAIALHQPDKNDPIDVLSKVGGFDIAGLVGVFIGAARYKLPVVVDGLISAVAALLATKLCEEVKGYLLPSHMGKEPASELLMKELGLTPMIYGELALGEGTGAALLLPMLDMAMQVYAMNTTFDDYEVKAYERYEERR